MWIPIGKCVHDCECVWIDIKQFLDASTTYWDNTIELTVKHNNYLQIFASDSQ